LFHTNISHSQEVYDKARALVYDREKIRFWVQHIAIQEAAIGNYIEKNGLDCLHVDYDQVCREPGGVLESIAARLNVQVVGHVGGEPTLFRKVRTKTNDVLVEQFVSDESNLRFLESLGLDESRLLGE
jgi:LPS sulfotransferase NodH